MSNQKKYFLVISCLGATAIASLMGCAGSGGTSPYKSQLVNLRHIPANFRALSLESSVPHQEICSKTTEKIKIKLGVFGIYALKKYNDNDVKPWVENSYIYSSDVGTNYTRAYCDKYFTFQIIGEKAIDGAAQNTGNILVGAVDAECNAYVMAGDYTKIKLFVGFNLPPNNYDAFGSGTSFSKTYNCSGDQP